MYEIITIDVMTHPFTSLGLKKYKYLPRVGEWVEMDIEGIGNMYEVVMVAHSDRGTGSDIFVKHLGITSEVKRGVFQK